MLRRSAADLRGPAPLPGMDGDPQATGPSGLECASVVHRVGKARLRSRQVPAGESTVAEPRGRLGKDDVVRRIVGPDSRTDEPDGRTGRSGGPIGPRDDGLDARLEREPAHDMQERSPANLDVADVVRRLRLHEVGRDALERLGILHQRDREIERSEELRLIGATGGRDQRGGYRGPGSRGVDAPGAREVQRGVNA